MTAPKKMTKTGRSTKINRICFLNPQGYVNYPAELGKTDTGGQTLYVLQLAQALGKKGIKVDIVTRLFEDEPKEEKVFENVSIVRIPAGNNKFVPKKKLYELMPEMMENLMQYIEKTGKKYDIVHSHYWDGGYAGILLSKMLSIPHVHTPHSLGKLKKLELSVEQAEPQTLRRAYRYHVRIAIEQKILSAASAIVAICETSRIQLLEHYLVDFEKLHVIYPGVNTDIFKTTKNKYDASIKFPKNMVLTVSRMVPAKGIDRVIDALSLIKSKAKFTLFIGGGTGESLMSEEEKTTETQIEQLIKKLRMQDNIQRIGHISHDEMLPAYYRASSVFILAGRYEPFGLTTLEAMACGTVPIVSSVAGSREIIIDGLNGFIVDTHDRKHVAEIVLKLLKDTKLRNKVAENAAFTIKEHYSWDKIVLQFIRLYENLS